ncbi:ATPase, T2SS/T4P/T4SS family [Vibrio sp. 10N.261.46.E12]|uniref:GspE/PulE family protein n=1 Tax=unclassified Vibrio TaxID=2614977 RepID=UPI000978069A|nr:MULTISPECIES: ATPase, T2SS/T4P/T4SS family [unclassified Vibrio]OMO34470.1 hypothetical protein BH584_12645 [Vibrio sp. 10N.261.45.E1]PMJ26207.1 hypothetical protein BCU27_09640 [Vibrio sp. 10N.286.45.B6]PML82799.1 hypothetical protein BCT66_20125 [Vibrio sp. 10N.261.49.E11]PMM90323.1 hypothetical protein BCT46_23550 [Vibrio sp. 10N.261.46.E8]PMN43943.1 hypothetical protein BCT32_00830 [Vibrio sp. 10N.261.45.E11]
MSDQSIEQSNETSSLQIDEVLSDDLSGFNFGAEFETPDSRKGVTIESGPEDEIWIAEQQVHPDDLDPAFSESGGAESNIDDLLESTGGWFEASSENEEPNELDIQEPETPFLIDEDLEKELVEHYRVGDIDLALFNKISSQDAPIVPLRSGLLVVSEENFRAHYDALSKIKNELSKTTLKKSDDNTTQTKDTNVAFKLVSSDEYDLLSSSALEQRNYESDFDSSTKKTADAEDAFNKLIQKGFNNNATDIQLVLGHTLVVNFIVDKRIRPDLRTSRSFDIGDRLIAQAINMNPGGGDLNYDSPQSLNFKVEVKDKDNTTKRIQLRGEKVPIEIDGVKNALGMVIRLVKTEVPQTLEALGVEEPIRNAFKRALLKPKGMILVTGPTSSGKTTLLAGALHYFPKDLTGRTIEDPVELKLHDINENIIQMSQPKERWSEYLESILRLAPKMILLGETRNLNQASTLIEATMTGHITLSTLHTNSAIGIIDRLLDMGIPLEDITAPKLLELLVATRLVPKTCQSCALTFDELSISEQAVIDDALEEGCDKSTLRFANQKQEPCKAHSNPSTCHCSFGVKGMVGITEFINPTEAMTDYIRENKTVGLEDWLRERGWVSMKDVAIYKAKMGLIDLFLASGEIENLLQKDVYDPDFHTRYEYYKKDVGRS